MTDRSSITSPARCFALLTAIASASRFAQLTPQQLAADPTAAAGLSHHVVVPTYDRSAVQPGIVHLGLGAFPRAHLAYYMDALLHTGDTTALPWGISGVGIRPDDRSVSEALKAQDGQYTVVGRGGAASDVEVRVVGSVLEYIFAPDEPQRLLDRLLSPHTRIVRLTVTEGGYESDKNPDLDNDSTNYRHFQTHLSTSPATTSATSASAWPRSAFGWIVLGLDGRRRLGLPPYTVMSMDNVQLNGVITKQCLLHVARPVPELSSWMESSVVSVSSMVDRITPVTMAGQRELVRSEYGIDDRWPLLPEQWIQ